MISRALILFASLSLSLSSSSLANILTFYSHIISFHFDAESLVHIKKSRKEEENAVWGEFQFAKFVSMWNIKCVFFVKSKKDEKKISSQTNSIKPFVRYKVYLAINACHLSFATVQILSNFINQSVKLISILVWKH